MSKKEIALGTAFTLACWLAAVLSVVLAHERGGKLCALDSVPLKPEFQVDVVFADGTEKSFCNPLCAAGYIREGKGAARSITVRDENTGKLLDAESAIYVESEVFTHRESASRIHVFSNRADAEEHAQQYRGAIIPSPFKAITTQHGK
jgi:hypothetical protein